MSANGWRAGASDAWASLQSAEPGTRRKKLAGYLQAANELRQNYQQQYIGSWGAPRELDGDDDGMPGAFPDAGIVSSGQEEMVIFPTYAMRHIKVEPKPRPPPSDSEEHGGYDSGAEAEYWAKQWSQWENDRAVVDVDVRGWIYSPHTGPMNRKNRILMGLARRLSGIPAPTGQADPKSSLPIRQHHEEEEVEREAESIMMIGEEEADTAAEGRYSEHASFSRTSSNQSSRSQSPRRWRDNLPSAEQVSAVPGYLAKRSSALWTQQPPPNMSPEELKAANTNLISRMKPFMALPAVQVPVTVFFYNGDTSQSRTAYTNESGQFYIRAALDFVPTHTRVLASEELATVQEVKLVETAGVSLISDIDDTIKHSAVTAGAREIFRNTFVAELDKMAIEGVSEWYTELYDMGVQIHYVSNSPWQLYPLIASYFKNVGLPPGSFHLKQYSGMLQGIFEPVAERKKGTLQRLMADFPNRKFLLVGDSGEADLEVYTDVVLANPGRILGIFIRDVTTPLDEAATIVGGFFDKSNSGSDKPEKEEKEENLIDFSEPESPAVDSLRKQLSRSPPASPPRTDSATKKAPPAKPAKPSNLRSTSTSSPDTKIPPTPPKPRAHTQLASESASAGILPAAVKSTATSVYNALPSTDSILAATGLKDSSNDKQDRPGTTRNGSAPAAYPPPPRRTPMPVKSTTWAPSPSSVAKPTVHTAGDSLSRATSPSRQSGSGNNNPNANALHKRLELWRRRWEKAEHTLRNQGVVLVTWRVGSDVMKGAVALVEKAQREDGEKKDEERRGRSGNGNVERSYAKKNDWGRPIDLLE